MSKKKSTHTQYSQEAIQPVNDRSSTVQSPLIERDGRLFYDPNCKSPEFFAQSDFEMELFGDRIQVDPDFFNVS